MMINSTLDILYILQFYMSTHHCFMIIDAGSELYKVAAI